MSSSAIAEPPADRGLHVTKTAKPGSRLALEVSVPAKRCQQSIESAISKLSRTVKLPGFRKGKVPRAVLIQQIGQQRIQAQALEELIESVWREALTQENINAIGQPELKQNFDAVLEEFSPSTAINLSLEIDVEPSPILKQTKNLRAEAEFVTFDPTKVDALIEQSRLQLAALVPVEDRPAASGDVAHVGFKGSFVDTGEEISGGSSDGMEVELEEGRMIPGFVEGIIGMSVGENRQVDCHFPESYPQEGAAGRKASFEINLLELKARELPPIDDDLAQRSSDKQTMAELKVDLEARLKQEAKDKHKANRQEALVNSLVEQLEVELPETLIQREVRNLVQQTIGQVAKQGVDVKKMFSTELVRSLMESSRPEAEKQLRRQMALQALATAESIEVSDQAVNAKLAEVRRELSGNNQPFDEEQLRQAVSENLLNESLLEWLEANNTVTEKQIEPETTSVKADPAN